MAGNKETNSSEKSIAGFGREIRGGHSNNKIKPKKQKAVGPTMTIMVSLPTVSLAA
jgi:hypothetical protein